MVGGGTGPRVWRWRVDCSRRRARGGGNAQKNTGPDDAAASRMTFWDVDGRAGDGCELEAEDVGRPCANLADAVENAVKNGMVDSKKW